MRYWISTTGDDLTQNYSRVAGAWEFVTKGYGQDGEYFERYETESDHPNALERLLDSDSTVLMYGRIDDEDRDA
jgi:hypothetical protein